VGSHDESPTMYVSGMAAVLSRWFTTYEEARASREAEGGYLLPYKQQYFITASEGILELGLDPNDPDWARIGWDWVWPRDEEAWERLNARRSLAVQRSCQFCDSPIIVEQRTR
jgi:hypothetical protein